MRMRGPFLLFTILLCTALGAAFGIYWYKKDLSPFLIRYPTHLQILGSSFQLPTAVTEEFEKTSGVRVRWTQTSTEADLAKMIAKDSQNFDLIFAPSFILYPLISPDRFKKLGKYLKPLIAEVSPDFLQLKFDTPNDYSLPMFWGYRGFLQTGPLNSFSFKQLLSNPKPGSYKVTLLPSPFEVYQILQMVGLNPNGKIKQDQWDELEKDLLKIKPFIAFQEVHKEASPVQTQSKTQGKPPGFFELVQVEALSLSKDQEELLKHPLEKSTLWVEYAVVPVATRNSEAVGQFLRFITRPQVLTQILEPQNRASAWAIDSAEIPVRHRAEHLREISIQNLELYLDHPVNSEAFLRLIEKVWNRKLSTESGETK